jgi:hypothetical protein
MLRFVYHQTKDGSGFGKGTMFIFGSFLYVVATVFAYLLPEEQANSNLRRSTEERSSHLFSTNQPEVDYGAANHDEKQDG